MSATVNAAKLVHQIRKDTNARPGVKPSKAPQTFATHVARATAPAETKPASPQPKPARPS